MKRNWTYANRIPLIIAMGVFVISLLYLMLTVIFGFRSEHIVYWLAIMTNASLEEIAFAALAVFITAMLLNFAFSFLTALSKRTFYRESHVILLILLASLFICGGVTAGFWQSGLTYLENVQSAHVDNHFYHLLFYSYDPVEGYNDYYHVYECDAFDILCKEIYTVSRTTGGIMPDIEQIALLIDPATNELNLQVNDEIVYTQ
jgi:hypothetical protein